jgi:6-phosphogluconolactonase
MKINLHQTARCVCSAAVLAALSACGGGDSGAVAPVTTVTPVTNATYTVGGTVTGLAGPGLILELLSSLDTPPVNLAVGSSGSFTFGVQLGKGVGYGIGVNTQPLTPPQYCQVADGSGIIGAVNVTNVQVTCEAGYTVGGTVSGLVGSGLVLQIAEPDESGTSGALGYVDGTALPVNADGGFTLEAVFPAIFPGGAIVGVPQQPLSPTQKCVVENSAISIQGANDTSVVVACSEFSYVANAEDNTLSAYRIDATSGALLAVGTPIATGKSPYAVGGTTSKQFVYVVNQGSNDVSAFTVNVATGALTAVPGSPFAAGTEPQALALYKDSFLYVANRGSNTLSAFAINATTGALTPLSPTTYATGQGPSSLAVHPLGSFLYVANNGGSNDISAFVIDSATGALTPMAGSPFAADASPFSLAFGTGTDGLGQFLPGVFLYSANSGAMNSSVSGFSVDLYGVLTALNGSPFSLPVSNYIATDLTGTHLYGTTGNTVVGYMIDVTTGLLSSLPGFPVVCGANCRSVALDPTDQFLYVANNGSANVSGFAHDASTGGLTPITRSPFAAGNQPDSVTVF